MGWRKLLGDLVGKAGRRVTHAKEPGLPAGGAPGTGRGGLAGRLQGVTLRQFVARERESSVERVLSLNPDGQFVYHEASEREGGFVRTEPRFGTWSAEGELPQGELRLDWVGGGTTRHAVEYDGGDTCRLDGTTTLVR